MTEPTLKIVNQELPWFKQNLFTLTQAYDNKRLPHGMVIAAPAGSGKRFFANQLIKSLICDTSRDKLQAFCGNCKSCLLFDADTHPDFYLLDRLTDNKGKQKKSIGIDQVRHLTSKLADMPQLGGWRVALITSVSALTTASFNALLKTLEEPGNNTLLVLLADNLQTIPATVKSRCRIIQPELRPDMLRTWLINVSNKSTMDVEHALKSCFNAPLKAKDFLLNGGLEQEQRFYQLCDQLLANKITPQELIEKSEIDGEQLWILLAGYYYHVEQSILIDDKTNQYQHLPTKLPFQLYAKVIEYNRAQFSGSNLQSNLQIQTILIQWFEIGRKILNESGR